MKKTLLLLGCFVILGTTAMARDFMAPERTSVNIKVGLGTGDLSYDQENNPYEEEHSMSNESLNLEYITSYETGFEVGAGAGIAKNSFDADGYDDLTTIPVYAIARYKWDRDSNWNPYVFANLGYAFSNYESTDSEDRDNGTYEVNGGLYCAVGVGAEYNENFSVELYWNKVALEEEYNSSDNQENTERDADFDLDFVTLAFGYRLDI
jgi:opacity protein-like surface antigen